MQPNVVVDVGNSRIKWGRCAADRVAEMVSLPHDDATAWRHQLKAWDIADGSRWTVAGVQPVHRDKLTAWLVQHAQLVSVIDSYRQAPVHVDVDYPDKVGLDRLFNAVAFNARRPPDTAGIIISAGTAVTVDFVDAAGTFRGGAIFPGRRLMAKALHDQTAQLPLLDNLVHALGPARNTEAAMGTGIHDAVLGGIEVLARRYRAATTSLCEVVITGGDAPHLAAYLSFPYRLWPEMTLEGIRRSG